MPPGRRSEDWVNSISRTLQWNSRQRQKAFHEWDGHKKDDERVADNKNAGGDGADGDKLKVPN
jgi:hypothetical protein